MTSLIQKYEKMELAFKLNEETEKAMLCESFISDLLRVAHEHQHEVQAILNKSTDSFKSIIVVNGDDKKW